MLLCVQTLFTFQGDRLRPIAVIAPFQRQRTGRVIVACGLPRNAKIARCSVFSLYTTVDEISLSWGQIARENCFIPREPCLVCFVRKPPFSMALKTHSSAPLDMPATYCFN